MPIRAAKFYLFVQNIETGLYWANSVYGPAPVAQTRAEADLFRIRDAVDLAGDLTKERLFRCSSREYASWMGRKSLGKRKRATPRSVHKVYKPRTRPGKKPQCRGCTAIINCDVFYLDNKPYHRICAQRRWICGGCQAQVKPGQDWCEACEAYEV